MKKKTFGEYFTQIRISAGLSLRKFCDEMKDKGFNLNSGNWSRTERGLTSPPTEKIFYSAVVKIFNLPEDEATTLHSIAKATKILPKELQSTELMEHMPVMLRKIDNGKLTDEEADRLIKWIEDTAREENNNG